jgi:hypothetical protein
MEMFSYGPGLVLSLLGAFLLLAAIIGGGLEIKEIKIPKIEKIPRVLTAALGLVLMLCGGVEGLMSLSNSLSPPADQTASGPPEISSNSVPNINYITVDKIRLPREEGVSIEGQNAAAMLIVNADKAEILANFYQDDSYLYSYYAGNALQQLQQNIENIKQSGQIYLEDIDLDRSYYVSMRLNNSILSIDECEYWKSSWFDPTTGNLVGESEWTLVPQTISIELVGETPYITAISFYQNTAFCTE